MSARIEDGGPAYPIPDLRECHHEGMSLRDWFAGQEIVTDVDAAYWELAEALAGPTPSGNSKDNPLEWLQWESKWRAAIKYARADAMLAARKETAK